jgi:hypothetical protein
LVYASESKEEDTPSFGEGPLRRIRLFVVAVLFLTAIASAAQAQVGSDAELAKKLANPISSLISVPLQYNFDCCFGPLEAERHILNIQPVIPTKLNPNWNLIVRTILPVIYLQAPALGLDDTFGLSDTLQSFFFSPSTTPGGITWGVGPAIQWPTGTDPLIDSGKWSAGPTAVILKQQSGWTYGALANQIWSFADAGGPNRRPEVNQTFIQPFLAYTWKDSTTLTLNTESYYYWQTDEWSIPINLFLSHVYNFGRQPVSLAVGGRWYADTVEDGPDWGLRAVVTFLFPTGG